MNSNEEEPRSPQTDEVLRRTLLLKNPRRFVESAVDTEEGETA
ncbi:hypothetical protein [Streptomyces sp. NPDC059278]